MRASTLVERPSKKGTWRSTSMRSRGTPCRWNMSSPFGIRPDWQGFRGRAMARPGVACPSGRMCTLAVTYPIGYIRIHGCGAARVGGPEPANGAGDPARPPGDRRRAGRGAPDRPSRACPGTCGCCGRPGWSTYARRRSAGSTACGRSRSSRWTSGWRTTARSGRTGSTPCTPRSLEGRRHETVNIIGTHAGARRDPRRGARRGRLRHRHRRPVGGVHDAGAARALDRRGLRRPARGRHDPCRLHQHLDRPGDGSRCATRRTTCSSRCEPGTDDESQIEAWLTEEGRTGWWSRSAGCRWTGCTSTGPAGRRIWRTSAGRWPATGRPTPSAGPSRVPAPAWHRRWDELHARLPAADRQLSGGGAKISGSRRITVAPPRT